MRADETAAARRLAGTLIASIRRVTAVDPPPGIAIEFETKCGRVVHLTARDTVDNAHGSDRSLSALVVRDGPFAPGARRACADLTAATRVAFAGRPRVVNLVTCSPAGVDSWCLTLDTGFTLVWADLNTEPDTRAL